MISLKQENSVRTKQFKSQIINFNVERIIIVCEKIRFRNSEATQKLPSEIVSNTTLLPRKDLK